MSEGPYRDPVEAGKAESDEESTSSESEQGSQDPHCDPLEVEKVGSDQESTSSESMKRRPRKSFHSRPIQRPIQPLEIEFDYVPRLPQAPLPSVKLIQLGKVTAFFDGIVIIKSLPKIPGLDRDSALYFADRRPMGLVYDIFGPIHQPMYVVVYENRRKIKEGAVKVPTSSQDLPVCSVKIDIDVKVGDEIYCADDDKLSIKVLTEQLLQIKAYDEGDSGEEFFSDDEEERKAKSKNRPQGRATKSLSRGAGKSKAFKRNHLSQPVGNPTGNQQQAFQSYNAFCQQRFGGPPGEQVRFAQPQLRGQFGPTLSPQPLPNLAGWQPGQVNFPPNVGLQFPGPPYSYYPMGYPQSMPPMQQRTPRWGYPTPQMQPPYPPRRSPSRPYSPSGKYPGNRPK
ncbi:unnamed protein product [Hymenolepis diminuta]|uniref:H/ACA ribonucleoprotein complex non-core subunit NAF1 n=1 Tax=Hymenolepis diminuta TaxID=6216 RepID=A0A564YW39_HYMDI|nr:unnamed protein product [Hymenolepis diminuta]